jgi:uncharacterized membrane protein YbhN (UPF0104 family)
MSAVLPGLVTAAAIAGTLISMLFVLAFFPSRIIALYQFLARRLSPALEARGSALLTSFASGLSVLRNPGRFALVLVWTMSHWMLNALAFWIGFRAVGLDASYLAAMFTQSCIAIAITAPQGPGYLGVFQGAARLALGLYHVDETQAYAWAFSYWAFSFVPITTIGMIYFAKMGISLRELRNSLMGTGDASSSRTAQKPHG